MLHASRPAGFLALLALLLLGIPLSSAPAPAGVKEEPADLSGTYRITGTFPSGDAYTGTIEIRKRKTVRLRGNGDMPRFNIHDMKFHYSSGWEGIGVGALVNGRFVFALAHQGNFFTVAVLRDLELPQELRALRAELKEKQAGAKKRETWFIKGDPWYQDVWEYPTYSLFFRYDGDWGTEGIRRPLVDGVEQQDKPFGPGAWWWFQTHYNDKGKNETAIFGNHGNMVIEEAAPNGGVKITRNVWDSKRQKFEADEWACAGMWLEPGVLLLGMGGDNSSGVGYYELQGRVLKGKICDVDGLHPYPQTLTVPEDVASRNMELFP